MKNHISTEQNQQFEQEEYDVQRIVAERKDGNRTLYLVKWLGYPSQENTWQPYSNLKNVPEKIRQWKNKMNRRKIQKEMKYQLKSMNYNQIDSSSDLIENKKYKEDKANNSISNSLIIQHQTEVKNIKSNITNHERTNDKNEDSHSSAQNIFKSKKRVIQKVAQSKNNFKKLMVKRNKASQSQLNQQRKQPKLKSQRIQEKQLERLKINKKNSFRRNEDVQSEQNRQKIVIEISDSCDVQPIDESEQEIIVEESVSYSSLSKQKSQSIEPPQYFLNIQSLNPTIQEQKYKGNTRVNPIKSIKSTIKINENADIYKQYPQIDMVLTPQIGLMQKILSEESHFNIFASENQKKRVEFEKLTELKRVQKQDGLLYCTLVTNNGITIQKISYQSIQILRPDLIQNFFSNKS